jgi:kinesin family protein 1
LPIEQNDDPFWEPADTPVVIGVCLVPLSYLAHMVDFVDEPLTVTDYRGKPTGFLKVDIVPCDKTGKDDSNASVEDPMDLVIR